MKHRVVITGMGCLTSVGANLEETWQALNQGKTGIDKITQWDCEGWEHQLGAEIKFYDPKTLLKDRKLLKVLSRHDVIGLNAANQAIEHSGLLAYRDALPETEQQTYNDMTGVYVGSPGIRYNQQYEFHPLLNLANGDMKKFGEALFENINPMWLLKILPNNVLAYVGIQNQFKGANHNVVNHAVGGTQALAEAFYSMQEGLMDRACVVAYESAIEPEAQIYFGSLGALSPTGVKSFDKNHNGTVLGEGAASLMIETLESAKERGATIYGEILSAATINEAHGIFSIKEDGDGVRRAIKSALQQANLTPADIGMITAHANGNTASDHSEALVLAELFKNQQTPITGFKWSLGHTLTAAGIVELLLTVKALSQKEIPGIATLENLIPECAGLNISNDKLTPKNSTALLISRGFGSVNCAMIIRAGHLK